MFCKNCGKELADHTEFCSGCGTRLGEKRALDEKGIGKTKRNNINSLSYNNYSITNFSSNKHSN